MQMTANSGNNNNQADHDRHTPADDFAQLLAKAKQGCAESVNQLLEDCHRYMLSIANKETQSQLRQKVGASDIVQQSLINIESHLQRFSGTTRQEFLLGCVGSW